MNLKKLFILGAILLAGVGYLLWVEIPEEEQAKSKDKLLSVASSAQIQSLELSRKGETFSLVNTAVQTVPASDQDKSAAENVSLENLKKWELGDIKGADLETGTLNTLLTSLLSLSLDDCFSESEAGATLDKFGLTQPEIEIKVNAGEQATDVSFGKKNDYTNKRYLKVSGRNDLCLVNDSVFSAASKTKLDFRNKSPVAFVDSDLQSVSMTGSLGNLKLERGENGQWRIVEPGNFSASDDSISALTREIRSLKATDFVDTPGADKEYRLDAPDLKVVLNFKAQTNKTPIELAISTVTKKSGDSKKPVTTSSSYLSVAGKTSIFKLSLDPLTTIFKPIESLREKKLFKFTTYQVTKAEISQKAKNGITLVKDGDQQWSANGKNGDPTFIMEFLSNLATLEASRFPQETRDFGFSDPEVTITLQLTEGDDKKTEKTRKLIIGSLVSAGGTERFAGVDDLSEPFILSGEALSKILKGEEVFVKPESPPATSTPVPSANP